MNRQTGEIKEQQVFLGDFPMMTANGTFIINGTERVVVSQLVRSPGVYFDESIDKTSDKDVYAAKVIPGRGAWLEFDIDKKDTVGVRVDRKRRQYVTTFLRALDFGETDEELLALFDGSRARSRNTLEKDPTRRPRRSAARPVPQASPRRADHGRVGPRPDQHAVLQPEALRPHPGRPVQARTRSSARSPSRTWTSLPANELGLLSKEDILDTIKYLVKLHEGDPTVPHRRHRPLRQPADPHGRRADPEPDPRRTHPPRAGGA